ncbi:hypothetical protein IC006_0590 [Sulfuracidifex tepidarius]|uniref:Uncharacterized protein n=1 Tax=Sulfuracidifex tepidarius TaxID=1294262 RepID=A0A510DSW3_9CREN|nr:hypothetical protein IC006_0590 [Sulfuracidifex tepidarius]
MECDEDVVTVYKFNVPLLHLRTLDGPISRRKQIYVKTILKNSTTRIPTSLPTLKGSVQQFHPP